MPKKCVGVELIAIFNPGVSPSPDRTTRADLGLEPEEVLANARARAEAEGHLAPQPSDAWKAG